MVQSVTIQECAVGVPSSSSRKFAGTIIVKDAEVKDLVDV